MAGAELPTAPSHAKPDQSAVPGALDVVRRKTPHFPEEVHYSLEQVIEPALPIVAILEVGERVFEQHVEVFEFLVIAGHPQMEPLGRLPVI